MTVTNDNSDEARVPSAASDSPAPGGSGGFVLPFDPLRLLSAALRKWYWILLSALVVGGLAAAGGRYKFEPVFTATAQLMRQESGGTFRASELGEPFKPRQVSVATLVSLMKSPAVLQHVSEQTEPKLSPRAILGGLTLTPERNTDLITVAYKSSRSEPAALRTLNLFGAEVVRLVREMQAQEAADVNRLLKQQIVKAEADLRAINQELLTFSQEAGVVSVDKEIDAYLRKQGELDLKYEVARIDYETLDLKIRALEKELAEHNPLRERVQLAQEQLADLRTHYTDANPLVEEQKERVAALEKQLKEAAGQPIPPPRQGESGVAGGYYQELMALKTQKQVLAVQLEKFKALHESVNGKLRDLPEKGMQYARIKARQQSLETAQALLTSRQREAQLYEDNPLGYYRFFEAKPEQVEVTGRGKKMVMVTVGGGVFGGLCCLALVCLVESFDDQLKTAADVKRATELPLLATLPDLAVLGPERSAQWAFRTWMALRAKFTEGPNQSLVCAWTSLAEGEGCSTWLELLGRAASQREGAVLVVTNRPPANDVSVPLAEVLAQPASLPRRTGAVTWLAVPSDWRWDGERRAQWQAALALWTAVPGLVVLVELRPPGQPETLLMAEALPQLIWLVGSGQARGSETSERMETLRHARCQFVGAVLNREPKLFFWSRL